MQIIWISLLKRDLIILYFYFINAVKIYRFDYLIRNDKFQSIVTGACLNYVHVHSDLYLEGLRIVTVDRKKF